MIDIAGDMLLTMSGAIHWLEGRTGHRFGRSTIYSWTKNGIDGRVLETVQVGGKRFTSVEALVRWIEHSRGYARFDWIPVSPREKYSDSAEARRRAEELFG